MFRIPDSDGENASGLIPILVLGLIQDVVFAHAKAVAGQLWGHHVLDLDVVSKYWFFPIDLKNILLWKMILIEINKTS